MTEKELIGLAEKAAEILSGQPGLDYDVYVREARSTSVEVRDQKLDAYEEAETWGVGIRVMAGGGRMGFAYSTGSEDAVREAASQAVKNATSAAPDEFNCIALPPSAHYPAVTEYDSGIGEITEQDKIARAVLLERSALDCDVRVTKVRKASASFTEARWAIVSSKGVRASSSGTYFGCGIMVVAEEGGDSQMGYDMDYKRRASEIDFVKVGKSAALRAVGHLGARHAPSGLFPVVLDNMVASEFLSVLAASFSAESVLKGKSLLKDRLGDAVLSDKVNIYDDGLIPGGPATRAFDDEGVPSRRTPLVVSGVLKAYLHNSYTANRSGATSTGNAVRGGFRATPGVGPTNLYIEKGSISPAELMGGVSSGLLVQEVLGMHTANPVSGDFSVGVSGQWLEGGRVSYPVREAAISGNILDIFKGVEAVADDLRFTGRLGAPTLLLRPLSVSGS